MSMYRLSPPTMPVDPPEEQDEPQESEEQSEWEKSLRRIFDYIWPSNPAF